MIPRPQQSVPKSPSSESGEIHFGEGFSKSEEDPSSGNSGDHSKHDPKNQPDPSYSPSPRPPPELFPMPEQPGVFPFHPPRIEEIYPGVHRFQYSRTALTRDQILAEKQELIIESFQDIQPILLELPK